MGTRTVWWQQNPRSDEDRGLSSTSAAHGADARRRLARGVSLDEDRGLSSTSGAHGADARRRLARGVSLIPLACLAIACKPDVGSRCEAGEARCLDAKTQLICSEGRMIAAPCAGEQGCFVAEGVRCDIRGSAPGDACSRDEQGVATCSADGKTQLTCVGGAFVAEPCRGPTGCTLEEPCGPGGCAARCDRAVAQAGDTCHDPLLKSCNLAGTELLSCQAGAMQVALHCRGTKGCSTTSGQLACDLSRAAVDDPCPQDMDGKHACSADQLGMVICRAGRFTLSSSCKQGELCDDSDGKLRCAPADR